MAPLLLTAVKSSRIYCVPGAIFGDLALSGEAHRSEFAQVMQDDAEVLCIKIDEFQHMMQINQNLTFCVMKHFTQRLHRAEERLAKLMVKDARERIIEFLMEAADHDGRRVGFEMLVKHQMTQQDIANLTGTSRQTVTSVFNDLKRSNLIHFNRNSVLIRIWKNWRKHEVNVARCCSNEELLRYPFNNLQLLTTSIFDRHFQLF